MNWNDGWHMGGMGLWWILIIAAVGAALWLGARRRQGPGGQESPEQVLRRRYSNGDVDRETFDRMLEDLRK